MIVLIINTFQHIDQNNPTSSYLEVHCYYSLQPSPLYLLIQVQNLLVKPNPLADIFFNILDLIVALMLERAVVDLKFYHASVVTFTVID